MSLDPSPIEPVPEETARVARAIFPKGNRSLQFRDMLGTLFTDPLFADLFPTRGQPALAPWRLALVTLFQYIEGLPDRQAAEAVRTRIDWKYALGLSLTDPGFDFSVLSEFRTRLVEKSAEERVLDVLLEACQARGWLAAGGRQRTDSTHVLARVRRLNRIDLVGETLRATLNALAVAAPDWLQQHSLPEWWERYALPFDGTRLAKSEAEMEAVALLVGQDGLTLLAAIEAEPQVVWLREIPAVRTLQQVWTQHYQVQEHTILWHPRDDLPPASALIASPYDVEARYALKRSTEWVGYKVHLTETCDADRPHLITQVMTMPAPSADSAVTTPIQQALECKGLLPQQQIVDTGYVDEGSVGAQSGAGSGPRGPGAAQYGSNAGSLCAGPVYPSLGRAASHLSSGESQWELATDPGRAWELDREGDLSYQRLPPVPASWRLHARRASDADRASPGRMASLTSGSSTARDPGVQAAVRHPCRHRRYAFAGHPCLWVATVPLPGSAQSASPACRYRLCDQCRADYGLGPRRLPGCLPPGPLCPAARTGGLMEDNSPTVTPGAAPRHQP